jgi:hypothetical protein
LADALANVAAKTGAIFSSHNMPLFFFLIIYFLIIISDSSCSHIILIFRNVISIRKGRVLHIGSIPS